LPNLFACWRHRMSHGVKRQRESPEKEAARLEKEKAQINDYRALTEDVLTRVALLFEHPWLLASWKWLDQIRIRLDDHAPQEEPWILHSMELPPTYPPWRTFQRVCLRVRGALTEKESWSNTKTARRRAAISVPSTARVSEMLLDMAVSEVVSRNMSWRRLGYGIKTSDENAGSGLKKLYTLLRTVLDAPVHGWEYRRYVVSSIEKLRGVSLAKTEFDYTTTKTNNISNFSAWHNRAMLIPQLLPPITVPNFDTERKAFLQKGAQSHLYSLTS